MTGSDELEPDGPQTARDLTATVDETETGVPSHADGTGQDADLRTHTDRDTDADREVADELADERVALLDDGGSVVAAPEALPFDMPSRERFAALSSLAPTGEARVDAATARLDEVPDLPVADHVEVYDDVHKRLQDALSDTEVR